MPFILFFKYQFYQKLANSEISLISPVEPNHINILLTNS
jgi:hypothetical protein